MLHSTTAVYTSGTLLQRIALGVRLLDAPRAGLYTVPLDERIFCSCASR